MVLEKMKELKRFKNGQSHVSTFWVVRICLNILMSPS